MRGSLQVACAAVLVVSVVGPMSAQAPARFGLGRPATPEDIARIDIDIMPDGTGLPAGRGTSADGAVTYAAKCARCHGATGKEGPNDVLVGRLATEGFPFSKDPTLPHTIGNYWPHATTVFDYIRRAMPPTAPGSLTDDEVYGLTAFLLHANAVIPADAVMDRRTLPAVVMPARKYFTPDTRTQSAVKPRP